MNEEPIRIIIPKEKFMEIMDKKRKRMDIIIHEYKKQLEESIIDNQNL